MDEKRFKTCKVWLIIGAILSPAFMGGSFVNDGANPWAMLFLILYLVTIPMCCLSIRAIKKAKCKKEIITWGILSIIFVSVIGGVLILTSKFEQTNEKKNFEATIENPSDNSLDPK